MRAVSIIAPTGAIQEPLIEKGSGFEVIRLPSRVVEALAIAAVATLTTVCAVVLRILIAEAVFKHSPGCKSTLYVRSVDSGAISIENEHFYVDDFDCSLRRSSRFTYGSGERGDGTHMLLLKAGQQLSR